MSRLKIGVFDSGVGGLSVVRAIEKAIPEADVLFRNDTEHMPYATKPATELQGYVVPIIQELVDAQCDAIVIACNTVTTTLFPVLQETFPKSTLIGTEPMVMAACQRTTSKVIAVCATPTTLASKRYAELKSDYARDITVLEPDCSDWSLLIENNQIDDASIRARIEPVISAGADIIVLGCTHYHWIEEEIKQLAGDSAVVLQPEQPVISELKRALKLPV